MRTLAKLAVAVLLLCSALQAGQTITINYTIGSQVFSANSSGNFGNGDDLNAVSQGTSGFTLATGQSTVQTLMTLSFSTLANTAAGGNETDTILFTLNSSGALTVNSPNSANIAWVFTDVANHNFSSNTPAPVTFTYSDGTRLTVTPIALTSFSLANNTGATNRAMTATISYAAPEPATSVMLGAGLAALAFIRRKRA